MTIWQFNARLDFVQQDENMKTVSAEQVAVLAERVDTMLNGYSELRGILLGIATTQAVQVEKLSASDATAKRIFDVLERHDGQLVTLGRDVNVHSWTWKLIGASSAVVVMATTWALSELRAIQHDANERDKRLTVIEFIVGGRSPYAPHKQPETSSK